MLTQDQKKELFRLYPVLSEVDPDLLSRVLSGATLVTLARDTRVFDEFQPCQAFPFVLSGNLRVFKRSDTGRELSLYHLSPGDACIVTAGCLLGEERYNTSGQVTATAGLVMVSSGDFDRLLASTAFRAFIFSLISRRIAGMMQLVEEVAFQKLDRRLAGLLLRREADLKVSHQELAHELGTVREMVTRVVNSFADQGLVRPGRGRIEILDRQGLKRVSDDEFHPM